ncbi:glyoxalase/bleomycin resistance protein/dioxygenase [Beauveria bassiana ARSEF 2860]|uniref:Glyoxalase/bleomycin resistance protein/dioxygenase n=1 Tax=Beauveria bassiana (strain ARSEF 2860) TaxID=655819 RepID=J4UX17_BEAB2|nr:glyoxalase/bleomycin resistance protein/dioxygenase [Beauveria bassiana ARSEF 2860]EJP70942.1 glyoxalase/bleomycin resistance protein/dioxygenase [Beauveria bassiana ARSEF 2860]
MFDHVALSVPQDKYPAVVDFYIAALAPLGYEKLISMFDDKLVALGDKNSPMANRADFWLSGMVESAVADKIYAHWAFAADGEICDVFLERSKVDAFYEKALAAGGKDNGAPGPRPHFGPHYYAAFVIDPMGNNVEVVCRKE